MKTLATTFKDAVRSVPQFGLSCAIPSVHTVEILRGSAFDFLLIDAEHPPTSPAIVHTQLMALAGSKVAAMIKLPSLEPNLLKQYLDLGPDGLMAPNIDTAADAKNFVSRTCRSLCVRTVSRNGASRNQALLDVGHDCSVDWSVDDHRQRIEMRGDELFATSCSMARPPSLTACTAAPRTT